MHFLSALYVQSMKIISFGLLLQTTAGTKHSTTRHAKPNDDKAECVQSCNTKSVKCNFKYLEKLPTARTYHVLPPWYFYIYMYLN